MSSKLCNNTFPNLLAGACSLDAIHEVDGVTTVKNTLNMLTKYLSSRFSVTSVSLSQPLNYPALNCYQPPCTLVSYEDQYFLAQPDLILNIGSFLPQINS